MEITKQTNAFFRTRRNATSTSKTPETRAGFPSFQNLPAEIRLRIWELASEASPGLRPLTMGVPRNGAARGDHYRFPPVPALAQTCYDARAAAGRTAVWCVTGSAVELARVADPAFRTLCRGVHHVAVPCWFRDDTSLVLQMLRDPWLFPNLRSVRLLLTLEDVRHGRDCLHCLWVRSRFFHDGGGGGDGGGSWWERRSKARRLPANLLAITDYYIGSELQLESLHCSGWCMSPWLRNPRSVEYEIYRDLERFSRAWWPDGWLPNIFHQVKVLPALLLRDVSAEPKSVIESYCVFLSLAARVLWEIIGLGYVFCTTVICG